MFNTHAFGFFSSSSNMNLIFTYIRERMVWHCINFRTALAKLMGIIPANIYLFKVNNRNTRKNCQICSKLTIKKPEQHKWLFEQLIEIEQADVSWDITMKCPSICGSYYLNYNGSFSFGRILVAADCKFKYTEFGRDGRISDGVVFPNSSLSNTLDKSFLLKSRRRNIFSLYSSCWCLSFEDINRGCWSLSLKDINKKTLF